jgi:nucleotide-binding universal stress UspA family protein
MSATSMGFSSAVSLIMESPVPVMVLNEEAWPDFEADPLRMLLADDLSDSGAAAVDFATSFALGLPRVAFYHTHVESYADVSRPGRGKSPDEPESLRPLTPEFIEHLHREAEQRMRQRSGESASRMESRGGRYRIELLSGHVADEIEKSANAARADLVVFGQHKVFHRKPLHVGQVPFRAMLQQSRAVVVVPHK